MRRSILRRLADRRSVQGTNEIRLRCRSPLVRPAAIDLVASRVTACTQSISSLYSRRPLPTPSVGNSGVRDSYLTRGHIRVTIGGVREGRQTGPECHRDKRHMIELARPATHAGLPIFGPPRACACSVPTHGRKWTMLYNLASESDKDVIARAPLSELNHEIQRCLHGYETGSTSQGRKAFFERLVWLEKIRDTTHGVPAKRRRFGRE